MFYYYILILLFDPLIAEEDLDIPRDDNKKIDDTPENIVIDAKRNIETLLRLFYIRHGFDFYDPNVIQYMTFIGFMRLKELGINLSDDKKVEIRSTTILCAKGMYECGRSMYVGEVVFHMMKDQMDPADQQRLGTFTKMADGHEERKSLIARQVRADWLPPVDIRGMAKGPEEQRLEKLVQSYKGLDVRDRDEVSSDG